VIVSTAAELALFLALREETLRVAIAVLVADSADVSALDVRSLFLGISSSDDLAEDVVDVLTEDKLGTKGRAILRAVGEGIASTSNNKRDVPLGCGVGRAVDGSDLPCRVLCVGLRDGVEELLDGHVLDFNVTVLAGSCAVASEVVGSVIETADVDLDALVVHGSEPAARPAGGDKGPEVVVVPAGIGRVVSRSRSGDVHVVGDLLLEEHRSRVAGLHEEDEVLEHLLLGHGLKDFGNVCAVEIAAVGHGDKVRVAVVVIVHKHIGRAG